MHSTQYLLVFRLYKKFYFTLFLQKLLYKNHVIHNTEKKSYSTIGIISPVNVNRSVKFKKILV